MSNFTQHVEYPRLTYWDMPVFVHSPIDTSNNIIKLVCDVYDIPLSALMSRSRERHLTEARHTAMALIRDNTPFTLKKIGVLFGRDHTTVISAIRTVDDLLETSKKFKENYKKLEIYIENKNFTFNEPTVNKSL